MRAHGIPDYRSRARVGKTGRHQHQDVEFFPDRPFAASVRANEPTICRGNDPAGRGLLLTGCIRLDGKGTGLESPSPPVSTGEAPPAVVALTRQEYSPRVFKRGKHGCLRPRWPTWSTREDTPSGMRFRRAKGWSWRSVSPRAAPLPFRGGAPETPSTSSSHVQGMSDTGSRCSLSTGTCWVAVKQWIVPRTGSRHTVSAPGRTGSWDGHRSPPPGDRRWTSASPSARRTTTSSR